MSDLPITVAFVPDDHPIRSRLPMKPKYITIHETANRNRSAGDELHAAYILTPEAIDRTVLWHATADEDSITQHLPWDEVGWHAGDGYYGPGNRESIGLELCVNGNFEATQRLAARLVAHLVRTVPSLLPFPECLVQHNHWSGKNCPAVLRFIPGGWDRFVALCGTELEQKPSVWDRLAGLYHNMLEPRPASTPTPPVPTITVRVNGRVVVFPDQQPIMVSGRVLVPIRAPFESAGGTVRWDGESWTVDIWLPER